MLGVSPSSIAQGTALAVAITVIFCVTLLVLPVILLVFLTTAPKNMTDSISWLEKFFDKLAAYQTHHPWKVLLGILAITVFMLVGASQVFFSTSNSNWIPDDDPVALSFRELEYVFGQSDSIQITLTSTRSDLREVSTVRDIQELEAKLSGLREVSSIQSVFSDMPLDSAAIYQQSLKQKDSFNTDFTFSTITLRSEGFAPDESGESRILSELKPILANTAIHNTDVALFGDVVRFQELGESLQRDTGVTTAIGLLLVFAVATLLYFSLAVGIIALIPIIIAVLWAVGLMGWFGVPFTSLSTGIVSLVLGIGVDFSIHLVNSIRQAKASRSMEKRIARALHTTGGAIFLSSITTLFGFLALTFAQLLGTQRLGWSLGFSIFSVFWVTILFVPVIISLRAKVLGQQT
jgi:predicted RND superfamily exporter protein